MSSSSGPLPRKFISVLESSTTPSTDFGVSHSRVAGARERDSIRLFFTPGQNQCATVDSADPVGLTLGQLAGCSIFPPATYRAALLALRAQYQPTGRLASHFLTDANVALHQHTWRPRYFEAPPGRASIAQFTADFLDGRMAQVGP